MKKDSDYSNSSSLERHLGREGCMFSKSFLRGVLNLFKINRICALVMWQISHWILGFLFMCLWVVSPRGRGTIKSKMNQSNCIYLLLVGLPDLTKPKRNKKQDSQLNLHFKWTMKNFLVCLIEIIWCEHTYTVFYLETFPAGPFT